MYGPGLTSWEERVAYLKSLNSSIESEQLLDESKSLLTGDGDNENGVEMRGTWKMKV